MPMQIKVKFTDNSDTLINVFNDSDYQTFNISFEKDVFVIELDPDNWILKEAYYNPAVGGIMEGDDSEITIYPNPNAGTFILNCPEKTGNLLINIFDLQGKKCFESVLQSEGNAHIINPEQLKTGIYLLEIRVNDKIYKQKLVII